MNQSSQQYNPEELQRAASALIAQQQQQQQNQTSSESQNNAAAVVQAAAANLAAAMRMSTSNQQSQQQTMHRYLSIWLISAFHGALKYMYRPNSNKLGRLKIKTVTIENSFLSSLMPFFQR